MVPYTKSTVRMVFAVMLCLPLLFLEPVGFLVLVPVAFWTVAYYAVRMTEWRRMRRDLRTWDPDQELQALSG